MPSSTSDRRSRCVGEAAAAPAESSDSSRNAPEMRNGKLAFVSAVTTQARVQSATRA
jgi:hypothetical protein